MRKDRGLVKAEHEEKGSHPKSRLWVTEIKTTGVCEAGGMDVMGVYLTLGLQIGLWFRDIFNGLNNTLP